MNSFIYGYDDSIDPEHRDFSSLNSNFIPSTLLDFERNQALIIVGNYSLMKKAYPLLNEVKSNFKIVL